MICKLVHTATLVVLLGTVVSVQAPVPDVSQLGPQVGEHVPTFSLTDQYGQQHNLESLMGPNGLWLYFSRSVDW